MAASVAKPGGGAIGWVVGMVALLGIAVAVAFAGTAKLQPPKVLHSEMTPRGVRVDTLIEGSGTSPGAHDTVAVFYTGTLADGTVFDSNVGKDPLEFPLDRVIPGWSDGLQKMHPGGRARLTIPPEVGYGASGAGPIPPNSVLTFDIQLLGVKPAQ